jgi:RNA polymerase sigma factor (sigma-70 family)
MPTDRELLRQYAGQGTDTAFAELVRRHADLVYSVALRVTRNGSLAEDVTQAVFTTVAQQAGRLGHYETLVGWLHTTTRHRAIDAVRGEERRRTREYEATAMHHDSTAPETHWAEISPLLDEAVGQLREQDREAVLLRFFKNLSHQEVGAALGLGEDAARKRVDRALEKLCEYFARRGVKASSALLATAIAENSVQAAPVGLVARVTGSALAAVAGVTTRGIFFKILFMSTQAKLVAVAAIVIIAAAITLNWPRANQPSAATVQPALIIAGASATTTRNKTPPAPQVAQPVVAAVNPSKPSVPTSADLPANFDPRAESAKAELRSNLDFDVQLALSDIRGPDWGGDYNGLHEAELIQAKSFLDMAPTLNAAGDLATYTATDETEAKIRTALVAEGADTWLKFFDDGSVTFRKMLFVKIDGKWYEADQSGVPSMDDKGNPNAGNPTSDPFSKN